MGRLQSQPEVVHRFFSGTGFSYDRVATVCTWGFDRLWKRKILARIPPRPAHILDQGCGTGILTLRIARTFPACRVTGVELRDEYLAFAREKARTAGVTNVGFLLGRAEEVCLPGPLDCITSSYLAKYADLGPLVANARNMLRPGGCLILHDFTAPSHLLFRRFWQAHFALLREVGSRIFPEWRTVFYELQDFLRESRWLAEALSVLKEEGFEKITVESVTFGAAAIVTACRSHRTSE